MYSRSSRIPTIPAVWLVGTLCLVNMVACARPPQPSLYQASTTCVEFQEGIQQLAQALLSQLNNAHYQQERQAEKEQPLLTLQRQAKSALGSTSTVVIPKTVFDPFRVVETGEMLKVNASIEILMKQMLGQKLGIFAMTPDNLRDAVYVLNGVISSEKHPTSSQTKYHFFASLFEHKTGMILGNSHVCVNTLDYQPLDIYRDSPVHLKDQDLESLVSSVKRGSGQHVDQSYLTSLTVAALLRDGDTLYGTRGYTEALVLYEEAERRPEGKTMKVYAGLYNLYRLLQDAEKSERAFSRLVEVSVERNALTVKLLFAVNSAQFINKPETVREYNMWLRQISQYVARTPNICLSVVGHASHSGPADYNEKLSGQRSQFVQSLMRKTYPGIATRSQPIGMGFKLGRLNRRLAVSRFLDSGFHNRAPGVLQDSNFRAVARILALQLRTTCFLITI